MKVGMGIILHQKNGVLISQNRFNLTNSCYLFDGKDDYLDLNDFKLPNDFSISIWVLVNERKEQAIFYQGVNEFHFGLFAPDFLIRSGLKFENDTWFFTNKGIDIKLGDWMNFTTVFEKGKTVKLYLNSILVDESKITPNLNFWNPNLKSSIGAYNSNSRFFNGKIDDIAIYNRVLNQQEISDLYTSAPPCTNPSATITPQGNTTLCQGGFVNLNASIGSNYTYEWYNNGQLINGATASVYKATSSGNYTVKVIDGACNATSTATTVTVNSNPTATITPQGNTSFCQGGFVNLVASGGTSLQWNTGSSAASISATQSGTYTVNVFNSFGCQATASQQVTVNPLPNISLNALNQFTLKNATPIQLVANPTGGTFSGDGVQGSTFNPANVSLGKKTITYNYTSPLKVPPVGFATN